MANAADEAMQKPLLKKLCQIHDNPNYGKIVTIANLEDCLEMSNAPGKGKIVIAEQTPLERAVGRWEEGRFAWKLTQGFAVPEPIQATGYQRLWLPSDELAENLSKMIRSYT